MKAKKSGFGPAQEAFASKANDRLDKGRIQQKRRTRSALLEAAGVLLQRGITPSVAEVAGLANVSRATAYRYFPTQDSLLVEAPFEIDVPSAEKLFGSGKSAVLNVEDRVNALGSAIHEVCTKGGANIRLFLRLSMDRRFAHAQTGANDIPLRQGRRIQLIEAALQPVCPMLSARQYKMLSAALAMIIGIESTIALTDVVRLSPRQARQVTLWAVRALLRTALAEASKAPRTSDIPERSRRKSRVRFKKKVAAAG